MWGLKFCVGWLKFCVGWLKFCVGWLKFCVGVEVSEITDLAVNLFIDLFVYVFGKTPRNIFLLQLIFINIGRPNNKHCKSYSFL